MIELANSMTRHAEVHLMLATNHRFVEPHKDLVDSKVNFHPFAVVLHKSVRDNFRMLREIITVIRQVNPEVIHIQANGHRLFYLLLPLLPRKTALINTIHDPVKHTGDVASRVISDEATIYWCRKYTDAYIVHGNVLRESLATSYRLDISIIHSVHHGHFGIYKRLQSGQAKEVPLSVLFFGRIWEYKGLKYFIEAANLLSDRYPEARFHIVGAGDDIGKYVEQINAPENFDIVNERVSIEHVGKYFQQCTVVVLPYIDATQSGVIPVAYAYGKPVIASNVGAISEVVDDGKTGFLVPPRDAKALAEKIALFLENPRLSSDMKDDIAKMINGKLSWDVIAKETFDVYTKTLLNHN